MACFEGEEIKFKDVRPQEIIDLQRQLALAFGGNLGKGATPYGGPISAGIDPNMMMAQQIMRSAMGGGQYQPAGFQSFPGGLRPEQFAYPFPGPQPGGNYGGGGGGGGDDSSDRGDDDPYGPGSSEKERAGRGVKRRREKGYDPRRDYSGR